MRLLTSVLMGALLLPGVAHAYIGPGLGGGAIAAILGVLGAIFLALFAVVYYPVKRLLKKKKQAEKPTRVDGPAGS